MRKLVYFLVLVVVVAACSNEEKEKKEALLAEVMAAHDEVMPKMGELRQVAKALKTKADSLETVADQDFSAQVSSLREAAKKIEDANEGMMEWMRQFQMPDNESPIAEVLVYLQEQKEKVEKVKDDMLKSLEEGKALQ
jgi:anaerobic selenocysteine-containing dehydrogenase